MNFHVDTETFQSLFPFHIAVDRKFCIQSVGQSLLKIQKIGLSQSLCDVLEITHPVGVSCDFPALSARKNSLFVLRLKESGIELKGQLILNGDQHMLMFLCEPVVRQVDELSRMGVKLSDFAKHSQIADYMFMLQIEHTMQKSLQHSLEELSESEKRYHNLFSTVHDMIHVVDADGKIVDVNEAELVTLGYSRDEMLGMPLWNIIHPDFVSRMESMFQQLKQMKDIPSYETALMSKQGEQVDVEVSVTPVVKDGSLQSAIAIIRDITQRKKLERDLVLSEEKFHQAQKMEAIGKLVGGIAHDFNNMLAGMSGNLYLAKRKASDYPDLLEKISNAELLAFRAADMVQQLLTFSRKGIVHMHKLALNQFILETLQLSQSMLPESIAFHANICRDDLYVLADKTQLHQMILNLLNNARDAVERAEQPQVELALAYEHASPEWLAKHPHMQTSEFAHLSVSDNGCGMDEAQLQHIFEPFFTTKAVGKGTGLGLSMVYGSVQTHQGVIEVESQPGVGTSFHIYFPLLNHVVVEEEEVSAVVSEQGGVILLADDDVQVRETTSEVLSELGYEVLQAADGLEAIRIFKEKQGVIEIALLDMVMPHCGGLKLAGEMRAIQDNIPIIFMTGYDKGHVLSEGEGMVNSMVLSKPVNFDVLHESVQAMMHG